MRQIGKRAVALLVIIALFLAGTGTLVGRYASQSAAWAMYPANPQIYANGVLTRAGAVYDHTGMMLAQTVKGVRVYNSNASIRRATLFAVGDEQGNISTGVQQVFAKELTGYNPISGTYSLGGSGNNLSLSLDAKTCAAALEALGSRSGAVGVYNYKTGRLICMVSTPAFDPTNPPKKGSSQPEGIYVNRFFSSALTPGSIFKVVTSAAALNCVPQIQTEKWGCTGSAVVGGGRIIDERAHGAVNFRQALVDSCNVAFAQITMQVGRDNMQKYADICGFNKALTVDRIPVAMSTYNARTLGDADFAWSGVGQATDLCNPCQIMMFMGAIANGGTAITPYTVDRVTTSFGIPVYTGSGKRMPMLSSDTAAQLTAMMRQNVLDNYGQKRFGIYNVCAKTGTAEVNGKSPNSWFVGFVDDASVPLAFAAVVENAGAGIDYAAPIIAKVLPAAAVAVQQ